MATVIKILKDSCDGEVDETQALVKVLKNGNYNLAMEMILDPINGPRYLQEGDVGVKPLWIVLFGDLPGEQINLYLAKLMVERGINVNFRTGDEEYMSTWSCFEYLIDVIIDVNEKLKTDCHEIPNMIGVNNQPVKSFLEARSHLVELLKVFIEFGGNPNFRSRVQGCTLFHKILKSHVPDVEVILILCGAGGDINSVPRNGFPPIVSLINNSFCDNTLHIVKQIWIPSTKPV